MSNAEGEALRKNAFVFVAARVALREPYPGFRDPAIANPQSPGSLHPGLPYAVPTALWSMRARTVCLPMHLGREAARLGFPGNLRPVQSFPNGRAGIVPITQTLTEARQKSNLHQKASTIGGRQQPSTSSVFLQRR